MKIFKIFLPVLVLTFLLFSGSVFAIDVRSGENIVISEPVYENLYLFSGNVSVQADVFGDVYVLGGMVSIDGNVMEDLVVIGGRVNVLGDVGDDLRIVGGQASVYSNVAGDLVVFGGQIDTGSKSIVNGSVFANGGAAILEGRILGDLRGYLSSLKLHGTIDGNVNLTVSNDVFLSENSLVMGDFVYRKFIESSISRANVKGKIEYRELTQTIEVKDGDLSGLFMVIKVFSLINAIIIVFLLVLLCPKLLERSAIVAKENLMKTFAVGLLTMIFVIVGGLILIFTVLGIQIAIIFGFIFGAIIYLAKIFTSALLASYLIDFKKKNYFKIKLFFAMTLALLVYYLIGLTPFVGGLLTFILFTMGIGSIVLTKQYFILYLRNKNQI